MKRILMLAFCSLLLATAGFAQKSAGGHQVPVDNAPAPPANGEQIHWMSIDDVQVAMKKEPKKVWIDVYTDWCGWCKRMDKTTFMNPNVVKYMNEHFYAVKFDAEQRKELRFMGKMYGFSEADRANALAVQLLGGKDHMSYPTGIFMEENFQTPMPIPGYLDLRQMEMILKYLAEGLYKKTPWPDYQASFKATWM